MGELLTPKYKVSFVFNKRGSKIFLPGSFSHCSLFLFRRRCGEMKCIFGRGGGEEEEE